MDSMRRMSPTRAYSFGASREAYKRVYLKHAPAKDLSIPGPGTYGLGGMMGKEGMKVAFRKQVNESGRLAVGRL
jgi:hypothetical protein